MIDLMAEFNADVVGVSVVISTAEHKNKLVKDYNTLLILEDVDEVERNIKIRPFNEDNLDI